jgi:hypothetical protein
MLSKRGSISMSSQKRQSMYKRGGSISNLQDVVVDLTLDGDVSRAATISHGPAPVLADVLAMCAHPRCPRRPVRAQACRTLTM